MIDMVCNVMRKGRNLSALNYFMEHLAFVARDSAYQEWKVWPQILAFDGKRQSMSPINFICSQIVLPQFAFDGVFVSA